MPIDSKHPQHDKYAPFWERCRDTAAGSDAVKARGTKYLPQLTGQTGGKYSAYKMRALYFGATGRTVDALSGAIFRKEYILDFPKSKKEDLNDVTEEGSNVDVLLRRVIREQVEVGRFGLLVDAATEEGEDNRPYISQYKAENILNWRTERVKGVMQLVMVTLAEEYNDYGKDAFEPETKTQIRLLRLAKADGDSPADEKRFVYQHLVYRKNDKDQWVRHGEAIVPEINGKQLDYIPFKFINATDDEPAPKKPPLLDLADVNLSHYRTSADLEHGAHFTALPTPVLMGFNAKNTYTIGSGVAWVTDNPQADAKYLEYSGQGLGALRDLKKDKENAMAVLGARMLEEQKKGVEAADTHRMRQSGEGSILAALAGVADEAVTQILKWYAEWLNVSEGEIKKIKLTLNKDFVGSQMAADKLIALMKAKQAGEISQDTFLHNLKEGEIIPDGTSVDDEKLKIKNDSDTSGDGLMQSAGVTPLQRSFEIVRDADGKAAGIKEQG